jgi:DNA-binding MarR family transcriptional regulator
MPGGDAQYYFLLAQATNAVRRASDRAALAAAGITTAQAGALYAVAAARTPTQRELGATLGLGEAAITGLVGRLERKGLVRRTADPEDRRTRRLVLTEQGTGALAAIEPARRALNARIADVLGHDADRVAAALARLAMLPEDGA